MFVGQLPMVRSTLRGTRRGKCVGSNPPRRSKQHPEDLVNIRKSLVIAIGLALAGSGVAQADQVSDLKAQLEAMQKQMDALKAQLDQVTTQVQTQKQAVAAPAAKGAGQ